MSVTISANKGFEEIITLWNGISKYPTNPKDNGNVYYRRILMTNLHWPREVHYEFRCYENENKIGIDLHSEAKSTSKYNYRKVKKAIQDAFNELKIKNTELRFSPDENAMSCWIKQEISLSSDIKSICEYMSELIESTKTAITNALSAQDNDIRK